jgi:hypothetical protein
LYEGVAVVSSDIIAVSWIFFNILLSYASFVNKLVKLSYRITILGYSQVFQGQQKVENRRIDLPCDLISLALLVVVPSYSIVFDVA